MKKDNLISELLRDKEYGEEYVVVQSTSSDNPVILMRFEREGQAVRMLNHPSIVRGYAFGHEADFFYLIMEFVEGQDLSRRIKEKGRLPEKESLAIIIQIAQGLHHAHQQGIIHRDVKPENIMLTGEGQAKLADLGMAKTFGEDFDLTRSRTGMGTPNFMAPVLVHRLLGALLFTNLGAPKVRRTEQKCAERSLD